MSETADEEVNDRFMKGESIFDLVSSTNKTQAVIESAIRKFCKHRDDEDEND